MTSLTIYFPHTHMLSMTKEYMIGKGGIKVLSKFEGVDGLITGFLVRRMTQRVEKFFD